MQKYCCCFKSLSYISMYIFSCDCEQNPATPIKTYPLKSRYPFLNILGRLMKVFKNILPTSNPLSLHLIPCKLFSSFDYFNGLQVNGGGGIPRV